jgi:hypothetical protein
VRRSLLLVVVLLAVTGCGSSGGTSSTTTATTTVASPATILPGSRALYAGGDWAVVLKGTDAVAAHLVAGRWRADRSGRVEVTILGPAAGRTVSSFPQVAAELTAKAPLVESGLWVDGKELAVKGGGTPTEGTIYGAPGADLAPGRHVAVAYGRTDTTGTARAWSFRTR